MAEVSELPSLPREGTVNQIVQVKLKPLTRESFRTEIPVIPQPYIDNPPQALTREVFTDWLTRGFRYSRGNPINHADYVMWTGAVGNFDPFQAVDIFLDAGGFKIFSPQEKEYMQGHFDKIEGHKGKVDLDGLDSNLRFMSDKRLFLSNRTTAPHLWFEESATAKLLPPFLRTIHAYAKERSLNLLQMSLDEQDEIRQEMFEARDAEIQNVLGSMSRTDFLNNLRNAQENS